MKTEEIEKAARYFFLTERQRGYVGRFEMQTFKKGAELMNEYWQEKTRWISVNERLPEIREAPYWVVARTENGEDCVVVSIKNKGFFEYLKSYFTYWKEVEL